MAKLKTQQTEASVKGFLSKVADESRRKDCMKLLQIMKRATKEKPKMWGPGMVGFGSYHYTYESGHSGDFFLTGFAPRKQDLTLYIMSGSDRHESLMAKLGKHKTRKSCLYIKQLADVDLAVLEALVSASVKQMKKKHAPS